jgi:phosphate butyryltransferase
MPRKTYGSAETGRMAADRLIRKHMELQNFNGLAARAGGIEKKTAVVAAAHDGHTLGAVLQAVKEGYLDCLLVGNRKMIIQTAAGLGFTLPHDTVIDAATDTEAAEKAVALIRERNGGILVKGKLETATLMRAVVNKETGIRGENTMSHIALFEAPAYPKLLGVTDGGMIPYPSLEQKKAIIKNAARFFRTLGYKRPKIAVLAASETVNERMPETGEAQALKECCERKELGDCYVEGPVSLDLALSREAAVLKGYESPICGDADILMVPAIACGNILGKSLIYLGKAKMAGCIVGAKVPIVLTSRGAGTQEKYVSLLLTAALSGEKCEITERRN